MDFQEMDKPSLSADETWFPRPIQAQRDAKLRVFCFHGAGMESSIWTSRGTSLSPMPNPFIDLAQTDAVCFLAIQLPFRGLRRKEKHPETIQEAARQILQAMKPMLSPGECPYVLVGYSMGCWIAYELLCLVKQQGLPLPLHFVVAGMVSPDLEASKRPWKCTEKLDTKAFQVRRIVWRKVVAWCGDQLRAWSCNEILFQRDMWTAYEPLLRADHNMLDKYHFTDMCGSLSEFMHIALTTFGPLFAPGKLFALSSDVPCSVFRGKDDKQLDDDALFQGWFALLGNGGTHKNGSSNTNHKHNSVKLLEGNHGLIFDAERRKKFFSHIVDILDGLLLNIEYGH
ncbi:uncharacterized protein LOC34623938 [Cyclospora cayetanensis]|uniref:Uncharacterized protein LOC34623938 n=1 Tax=Cyclospora cayetanensis TaxID=88456 RepID=A0A6P6RR22_9EIME|nr:uncharacterized protein LOC34623938 [Cyclospora cayetanensis]